MTSRSSLVPLLLLLLVVLSSSPSSSTLTTRATSNPSTTVDSDTNWKTISGTAVSARATGTPGGNVFVGFAGYGFNEAPRAWLDALHRHKLSGVGVSHLVAVTGPSKVAYTPSAYTFNTAVVNVVKSLLAHASEVHVAGHSSGAFTAHHWMKLLGQDAAAAAAAKGKLIYYNLDGASTGFADIKPDLFKEVYAVSAKEGTLKSMNAASMAGFAQQTVAQAVVLDGAGQSGCRNSRCLHDLVIITKPHNPESFNVRKDYTDFEGRAVQVGYVRGQAPSGSGSGVLGAVTRAAIKIGTAAVAPVLAASKAVNLMLDTKVLPGGTRTLDDIQGKACEVAGKPGKCATHETCNTIGGFLTPRTTGCIQEAVNVQCCAKVFCTTPAGGKGVCLHNADCRGNQYTSAQGAQGCGDFAAPIRCCEATSVKEAFNKNRNANNKNNDNDDSDNGSSEVVQGACDSVPVPANFQIPSGEKRNSGSWWVQWSNSAGTCAANSHELADLSDTFRPKASAFIAALREGGATVRISSTLRSPKRAYLFNGAWRICNGKAQASQIAAYNPPAGTPGSDLGVPINWVHSNAVQAACDMCAGWGLAMPPKSKYAPSLTSDHIRGNAIDISVVTSRTLNFKKADGSTISVPRMSQGTLDSNTALHQLALSYGVKKLIGDEPHFMLP